MEFKVRSLRQIANISEIYNQVLMMLGHEIFDPEIGKRVLVDHGPSKEDGIGVAK